MAKAKQDEKSPEETAKTPDEGAKQETPSTDPVSETEAAVQEVLKDAKDQVDLFKLEIGEAMAEAKKDLIEAYEALPKDGNLDAGTTLVAADPVCALAEKIYIQMCMNARQGWTSDHIAKQAHEYAKAFVNCTPSGE